MRVFIKLLWVVVMVLSLGAIAVYLGGFLYARSLTAAGQPEETARQAVLEWTALAVNLFFGAVIASGLSLVLELWHRRFSSGVQRLNSPHARK